MPFLLLVLALLPAPAFADAVAATAEGVPSLPMACERQQLPIIREEAAQGHAWAQACLGHLYLREPGSLNFNRYAKALNWLRKAAQQGDLQALTELGLCYRHGKGVARDRVKAVEYFRRVAEGGYAPAQRLLGDCYAHHIGIGVPADGEKARFWYAKAAAGGDAQAQYALGEYYQAGIEVPRDVLSALKLYTAALDGGNEDAKKKFAEIHAFGRNDITGPDRRKEAWFLVKRAQEGDPDAMSSLAYHFQGHNALPKSYPKARYWAQQSDAHTKMPRRISEVELVEYEREGGRFDRLGDHDVNTIRVTPEYKTRSRSTNPADWHAIGQQYWRSGGDGDGYELAARWFAKAADAGYLPALKDLAFCYLVGIGLPQDDARAFATYEKAARLGDAEAEDFVGFCHEYGIGVPLDREKAVMSYRRAAEGGNPASQFGMAFRYMYGWGVPKDEQKAAALYTDAANAGYYRAMNALAKCYARGIGVQKDGAKAWHWYRKSYDTNGIGSQDFTARAWLEGHNPDGSPKLSERKKEELAKAAAGDVHALGSLGFAAIRKRTATEKELQQGVAWLQQGAEAGNTFCLGWLAQCYEDGRGVPRDLAKAFAVLKKRAEIGGAYDQLAVGNCYEDGIGVERDRARAITWYRRGAAMGDPRAREALKELGRLDGLAAVWRAGF